MNSHEQYLSDLKQSKVIHQKRKEQKAATGTSKKVPKKVSKKA